VREAPDPDLAINSRIGVASPILQRLGIWRTQNPSGELKSCKCNLPECGRGIAYGCDSCGRVQKFGSEIIFQAGSYPEFDFILRSFRFLIFLNPWLLPKVVTKWDLAGRFF
jgi:hypothetical protein